MKRFILLAVLPFVVHAQTTRSTTEKALSNMDALRTQTPFLVGLSQQECDNILCSVQDAICLADKTLDGQLPASIRVALHQQLSLYQQLTPDYLESLDRIDAKDLQHQLDALTAKLTAYCAHDTNRALPLTTLAHIRLANSYLHTLLNPLRFKRPSSWKKLTRGIGGDGSAALPVAAFAAGAALATGACFLYTINRGPGDNRYFLRRQCDDAELARQHHNLGQAVQAVEAVELGITGAKFMADKAEQILATEMGDRAHRIVKEHITRLSRCLEQDIVLCQRAVDALNATIKEQVRKNPSVEAIVRASHSEDLLKLQRDVELAEQRAHHLLLTNDRMPLAALMDAIGIAHTEGKKSDLTNRRPSTLQQVLSIFRIYYSNIDEPVRASYIYDVMLYKLLVGTKHFTGFIEQARTFIDSLSDTQKATPLVTAVQSYLCDYDPHQPAATELAIIALHQFVTETGPELVRS